MNDYEIIKSKCKIPENPPYIIWRPDVYKLIGSGFYKKFLILLGSSGSGKTTAVAEYIKKSGIGRVVYIRLAKTEKDFNIFSLYFIKALKKITKINVPIEEILKEKERVYLLSVYILNKFEKLKAPLYIIFDNFQDVADSEEVIDFLRPFFLMNSDKLHIIILSQEKPPFQLEKQILLKEGDIITGKKLYFSAEEIETVLNRFGIKPYRNLAEELLKETEGWPMGVVAAAKILADGDEIGSNSYKWLFSEVFLFQDAETKKLLLKIAPLHRIHPPELKGYLSKKDVKLLEKLSHKGLFIYKVQDGFKLHGLFREFLKEELERNPEKIALLKKLGGLFGKLNPLESVSFYIKAGDFDSASRIARENNFFSEMPYGYETMKYMIDKIPTERLFKIPEVAIIKAEILLRSEEVEGAISIVRRVMRSEIGEKLMFRALNVELESFLYRGRYDEAISTVRKIDKAAKNVPFPAVVDFYYTAAKVYYFSGNLNKCENVVNMLMEKLSIIESPFKRAKILNLYSIVFQFRRGKFADAKRTTEAVISMLESFGLAADPRYYVNLAMAEMELGEFIEAEDAFKMAYEVTDKLLWKERVSDIDVEYGFLWLMQGELNKAKKVFIKVEKDNPENPFVIASLHMGKSILLRKRKRFLDALGEAEKDLETTKSMGAGAFVGESLENIAKIYVAKGDFGKAAEYLLDAQPLLEKGNDFSFLLNLKLIEAIVHKENPSEKLAEIVKRKYKGMMGLDSDILEKYAKDILYEGFLHKLVVNTFGNFSVYVADNNISYKDFRRKGILVFFKFLVANYPLFVSMDKIADSLYTNLSLEQAKHNVYVAVSVLNKLFLSNGISGVIDKESGMYRMNPNIIGKIDFVDFKNFLKKREYLKAVNLYKGDFLEENLYDEWTMEKRDSLLNSYVDALLKASEKADSTKKEELLKMVLKKDKLNETALFMLIKHYIALKETGKARKLYMKAEREFEKEYNLPLPDKFKRLYK